MFYQSMLRRLFMVGAMLLISLDAFSLESDEKFSQYYDLIYQVRVVAEKAGSKSSIGSGFQISESGLIVTNYHVISSYVQYPEKNKITYESHTGEVGELKLIEFDVVNDLAILQHPKPSAQFFKLSETPLNKGETIFALGNPGDFGIKLVKGPNNGLSSHRYDELILFSASINGGMSGGPALNANGDVIGVNVSTAGGQLSFLVPVEKVVELIEDVKTVETDQFQDEIARQLKKWQRKRIGELIESDWPTEVFSDKELFGQVRSDFKCWGRTNEDDNERRFNRVTKRCSTGNVTYLAGDLNTGNVVFWFRELESIKLNSMQFSQSVTLGMYGSNKSNFDYTSNYQCNSDFLDANDGDGEYVVISTCIRRYKKLTGLYDSLMRIDRVRNKTSSAALVSMYAVEKDQIEAMNRKFSEKVL